MSQNNYGGAIAMMGLMVPTCLENCYHNNCGNFRHFPTRDEP